jgi:mRNA interferase MazF
MKHIQSGLPLFCGIGADKMKRFDIYTVSGGTYSAKPRPAVLIQAEAYEIFDSVTVIPLTSVEHQSEFRIKIEPSEINGLRETCWIMLDKITTVKSHHLGKCVGHIDKETGKQVEIELAKFLGFSK